MPVGLWVMRTAVATLFTFWPPAPPEWKMSMRMSFSSMSTSTSSASGSTATVAVEVWMRPWASVLRHALHAVAAALVLEAGVGALAVDLEDDLLEAALLALAGGDDLDVPVAHFGVAGVHAEEVAGEQRRFLAAGAAADFDDDVAVVVRVGGQEGETKGLLQALVLRLQGLEFFLGQSGKVGIVAVSEGAGLFNLLAGLTQAFGKRDDLFEMGALFAERGEAMVVGDCFRLPHLCGQRFVALFQGS